MAVLFSERMGGGDSLVRKRKGVTACLVKVAESRHNLVVAGRRECKTALQEGVFQAGASSGLTQVFIHLLPSQLVGVWVAKNQSGHKCQPWAHDRVFRGGPLGRVLGCIVTLSSATDLLWSWESQRMALCHAFPTIRSLLFFPFCLFRQWAVGRRKCLW